jgi:hypothetical protein
MMAQEQDRNKGPDRAHRNARGFVIGITYHGHYYPMGALTDADMKEVERYLASQRRDPLEAIRPELERAGNNARLLEMLVDRAYRDLRKPADVPGKEEVADWLDTRSGAIYSIWLMLRREQPSITLPQVEQIFADVNTAEMLRSRDEATFPPKQVESDSQAP